MNGLTPPKSGAAEWPPGPAPRASRGAPEPSDAFAGILNSQKARTATAEGQDRSPKTDGRNRRDDDGSVAADRREADVAKSDRPVQHHEDDAQAKPADSVEAKAPAAPEAPVVTPQAPPVQSPDAVAAVPAPVVAQPEVNAEAQTPAETQTQNAPVQVQVATAPAQAKADQPEAQAPAETPQSQPQQSVQQPQQQTAAKADDAAAAVQQPVQAETQPVDDKPAAQPAVVPVAKPKQGQADTGQQNQSQQQPQQQGSLPQPAAEQARTVAQAYGRTAQHTNTEVPTTAQSGTPAAPVATPVASGQPAAARGELAPPTPVPLSRAAETVEHVMRLASSRGVTHARIALSPESLGSIDVHLRHTADGLVAKLVAHAPEAVQQLQQAAADLRQQLEGQGVNLLSLDIGHSAADQGSAAEAGAGFGEPGRGDGQGLANGDASGDDAEATVNSTLQLPDGVLVDVLA